MTEVGHYFDGVAHSESMMAEVQADIMRDGILAGALNQLVVTAPGGMNVQVGTGRAWLQGFWYKNDAAVTLPIAANSSGSTRFDSVVLSLNRAANTLSVAVRTGTPGAGAPPTLVQVAGGDWEVMLAFVTVANGAASIVTGNITDQRYYPQWYGYTAPALLPQMMPGVASSPTTTSATFVDLDAAMGMYVVYRGRPLLIRMEGIFQSVNTSVTAQVGVNINAVDLQTGVETPVISNGYFYMGGEVKVSSGLTVGTAYFVKPRFIISGGTLTAVGILRSLRISEAAPYG